jgi:small subunit ribosomal protein S21
MAEIRIRENESLDNALRRFKDKCRKTGIFAESKKRRFYEKPSEVRKRKIATSRTNKKSK